MLLKRVRFAAFVPVPSPCSSPVSSPRIPSSPQHLPFEVPHLRGQVTGSSVGVPPQLHDGAPVPEPFGPEYLVGYISDRSSHGLGLYYKVTRQFDRLRAEYPEVME